MKIRSINTTYRSPEQETVQALLNSISLTDAERSEIKSQALKLIKSVRADTTGISLMAKMMQLYPLSRPEGITLMSLAEALLRIPDARTANALIEDKLGQTDWTQVQNTDSAVLGKINSAALQFGKLLSGSDDSLLGKVKSVTTAPILRTTMKRTMRLLADEFILGSTMQKALKRAAKKEAEGYRYSYDMLGEAAMTQADAERYLASYHQAIKEISAVSQGKNMAESPSISVKLSALHPRFEAIQEDLVLEELTPKVIALAESCKAGNVALTIDAEEADVLELTLKIFDRLLNAESLQNWEGLGLAVQAYQKRAPKVLQWLYQAAASADQKINVRLVKGAYWDTEIKHAQVEGLTGYPVFTRKCYTDVSYIACAQQLAGYSDRVYARFATHNAHTIAVVRKLFKDIPFEFQKLHGMGDSLYRHVEEPCRIYAPVGSFEDLLPYLVRRLLENGANTSFVHQLADQEIDNEKIVEDPIEKTKNLNCMPHPKIPLPEKLYSDRHNSMGIDTSNKEDTADVIRILGENPTWKAAPVVAGKMIKGDAHPTFSPQDTTREVGSVVSATTVHVEEAFTSAHKAFKAWSDKDVDFRAKCLEKTAALFEAHRDDFIALCVREAGKSIPDAVAEIREAADFCRYYARQARLLCHEPKILEGPTGEHNQLSLHGRGVFVCISPWNFPLAIFTGQVVAALVTGNCVLAKPAEPTPLIAGFAVDLMYKAGIPKEVLQFLPGKARDIGDALTSNPLVAGIAMTGSVATGNRINRALAEQPGAIKPLIAETGGLNAMIVDSSALTEHVVRDILISSFQSAGQRCSALRVLFLQEEVADKTIEMLAGAMADLSIGDPGNLATDVGPVISAGAQQELMDHIAHLESTAKCIFKVDLPDSCQNGSFVPPAAYELNSIADLTDEKFGPILHVIRYKAKDLDKLVDQINQLGYGLTLGTHTRVDKTSQKIHKNAKVGNTYVNRSMIGAVVGVQPFGGEGLSGTGPKAGGPHYLLRFMTERTLSVDTTAKGGNAALMMLED